MLEDLISDVPQNDPSRTPPLVQPEPVSEQLVEGYLKYFAKADSNITWLESELEIALWICPPSCDACAGKGYMEDGQECPFSKTVVMGKIDTVGQTADRELFFMDLKTSAPPPRNRINEWKQSWRMSPQALTYGLLILQKYPDLRRFTVRRLYKSSPPTFDFEWFRFALPEIEWWRGELLRTADEIRRYRKEKREHWPPNFQRCFKYGLNYICPFFNPACSQLKWSAVPEGATPRTHSHLKIEDDFHAANTGTFGQPIRKGVVILGASRMETWECRERFRRNYEEGGVNEPEAIARSIGTNTHALLDQFYRMKIKPK